MEQERKCKDCGQPLGEDFFRRLPTGAAVYLMCGPQEGVLYVGKARKLRRRLSAYRVANPERLPRRIIQLLHQVTRTEFDECPDERTARHREELLIAVLSPKFNRAGKVRPLDSVWGVSWKGRNRPEYPRPEPPQAGQCSGTPQPRAQGAGCVV